MKTIILIFLLQMVYVPLLTLRTIFLVKNLTILTSLFGIMEMLVYLFGLSLVFNDNQNIIAMIAYAVGFGLGMILGTKIENKLAIGYIYIAINTQQKNELLINTLREAGFAVTVFLGEGRDSERFKYEILATRKRERELFSLVESIEPNAFIISYEPKSFKGGFLVRNMKVLNKKTV
ncbi:DUF2179 domain-containing protein [Lysinibacillus endophyticus]|uniref:DUF2179 domain-containing protein n=1 Tax=Ureibacillus endophyticus TaxID=1978490 RepID=UPI00209E2AFA|nr:DUF2179 domain-containing protein [Lysinibacillus endophyticus]MCP1146786.1 DUF2179 domain-containing protein [Lysinibacillus endophyticus]